ncbi:MAG: thioredoxin family protein [Pseudomonadota bacterium]|nr:thioredoxin family protein [Gammaproteobacteria bacterium]MBU1731352.1 thioredoxin family protein [Gammaproteobacteria bacterium]MBU1892857.1 thioredoxin family protein [Gammaproteobacteria bacterium]
MQTLTTASQIEQLKPGQAVFILFGGAHCGVCQIIKPKIESLMAQQFPDIALAYVDCELNSDICAQNGVFSLPAIKLYIEGQLCLEKARSFSLMELVTQVERIYRLWKVS